MPFKIKYYNFVREGVLLGYYLTVGSFTVTVLN